MEKEFFNKLMKKVVIAMVVQTFAYIVVFGGIAINDHFKLRNVEQIIKTKMDYDSYINLTKLIEEKHQLYKESLKMEKEYNRAEYEKLQNEIATINKRIDQLFRQYTSFRGTKIN